MRNPKLLLFLAAVGALTTLYLLNARQDPSSQGVDGGSTSTANPPGQPQGRDGGAGQGAFIEVETPSGIERLRAERITFVILNTGNLAYGANLAVSGYLFGETEEVSISVYDESGKLEADVGKTWTDKDGNLPSYAFDVPRDVSPGKHKVRVTGTSSGKRAEASFSLSSGSPWVNPSTYSGKPQSILELSGGGYLPGEEVAVYFDSLGSAPIAAFAADAQGAFDASVPVPFANEGDHGFVIVGEKTNSPVRIPFSVLGSHPWGSISNYSPQPNQAVGFAGHDFVPGEEVRVYLNQLGPEAAAVARADVEGNFEVPDAFYPPPEAVGENAFLFVGNMSQTVVEVPFEVLPLTPGLELTVYAGLPGTPVGFTGQGFVPSERLRAYLGKPDPGKELSVFEAGQDGSFTQAGTFNIPFTGTGSTVAITLVGDRSKTPVSLAFAVLPYSPWANLSAYLGPPGTEVVVDGGGFAPGEPVSIHFQNRQSAPVLVIPTGPDGSFQRAGPIAIPSTGGESTTVLIVGDKSGAEVAASFAIRTLERQPEGVPSPPANESPAATPTEVPGQGGQESLPIPETEGIP